MTNTLVTSTIVAPVALAILKNMLTFSARVNRDYEDEHLKNFDRGYAPGVTIKIRKPPRYTYRTGATASPQATVETTVDLTLAQGGCDINFTSLERTVSLTRLEDKIAAAIAPVANEIDRQGLLLAETAVPNALNPTGVLPTTQLEAVNVMTAVNRRLDEAGAPVKDGRRHFIMGPGLNASLVAGFSGLFNMSERVSGQYRTGYMQDSFGLRPGMDQNVATHTNGAATATNISGAGQTGSSLTVVAVAGGTLAAGTVITLPGVYAVNPQSRQSTGVLQQFVVTANTSAGATSIPISPAIVTSGAFQNVTASPTTAQPYVIIGSASTGYACNVGFHEDAFTLAMVPMWKPGDGTGAKAKQVTDDGFTLKVTEFYDGTNDKSIFRIDVLFGWACTYPELAVKYYSV
jgi:P22 coat protein - gene protein 5